MSRARMREVSRPVSAATPRVSIRSATRSQGLRPFTDSDLEASAVSWSARLVAMRFLVSPSRSAYQEASSLAAAAWRSFFSACSFWDFSSRSRSCLSSHSRSAFTSGIAIRGPPMSCAGTGTPWNGSTRLSMATGGVAIIGGAPPMSTGMATAEGSAMKSIGLGAAAPAFANISSAMTPCRARLGRISARQNARGMVQPLSAQKCA
mmetsp:Transcript_31970/g.100301  ORF Transcript_31970/g.100301 Transcript_31970/m.100301 type:complete len:206 (+) Transcript_31970:285-902(+)